MGAGGGAGLQARGGCLWRPTDLLLYQGFRELIWVAMQLGQVLAAYEP